jgi:protein phosphatase 1L
MLSFCINYLNSFVTGAKKGSFSYGYSSFKGKRASMEDFYHTSTREVNGQMVAFFGVFDGTNT